MKASPSIGQYLIDRLYEHGVRHVFGIPGDYVLGLYDQLLRSKLKIVNTCDEQGAGFAADDYERDGGLGAVCTTTCCSELKVADTSAGTFVSIIETIQSVILADFYIHRFVLQKELLKLLKKTNIPFAATVLGKSVVGEEHPLYLGIYEGAMGRDDVRQYVESSDCLLMLGAFMTDINLGVYTASLEPGRSISATSENLSICYHSYVHVRFKYFMLV